MMRGGSVFSVVLGESDVKGDYLEGKRRKKMLRGGSVEVVLGESDVKGDYLEGKKREEKRRGRKKKGQRR